LVRACILGALLPSTGDPDGDLRIFDMLMGMHDEQILPRLRGALPLYVIEKFATPTERAILLEAEDREERLAVMAKIAARIPYHERIEYLVGPEEVDEEVLTAPLLPLVNEYLGTSASSLADLVRQLGEARYGHCPLIGDTFCGGGSVPFEAARIGCDVYA